jgi:cytochrome P450 family 4
MLELKTAIIEILSNFILEPVTRREDIVFVADIILGTRDPIKVKFQKRTVPSDW